MCGCQLVPHALSPTHTTTFAVARAAGATAAAPATQATAKAPATVMAAAPATSVAVGGNDGNMVQAANVGTCMACKWRAVTDINPSDSRMQRYSSRIACGFMYLEEVLEV